jgi:hypothetical protein
MPGITTYQPPGATSFGFSGISDGTYDVTAQSLISQNEVFLSDPYRVIVKGADVTGIELTTKPLASITGRLVLEPSKELECKGKRRPVLTETLIIPLLNSEKTKADDSQPARRLASPTVPDAEGVFSFRNLPANQYGFDTRHFVKYWYLHSIALQATARQTTAANASIDVARNWITLKSGERINGLSITLAEGAASLKGSIRSEEGQNIPPRLYLHLIPAEREKADDVLRFFATPINEDKTFGLSNLPPGRYWALVGTIPDGETKWMSKLRLPEQSETRSRLRREAEASRIELELKPCQNIDGYQLTFKSPAPSPKQR